MTLTVVIIQCCQLQGNTINIEIHNRLLECCSLDCGSRLKNRGNKRIINRDFFVELQRPSLQSEFNIVIKNFVIQKNPIFFHPCFTVRAVYYQILSCEVLLKQNLENDLDSNVCL
jgi:hypothetical protein